MANLIPGPVGIVNDGINYGNNDLKKLLIDSYIYRDLKENNINMTRHIEKLVRHNYININDQRFNVLFSSRNNIYDFYNSLNINELQFLGF
jgi:hypothetical protein